MHTSTLNLRAQQQVFDFGADAISRGQIGPSSFVETIILLFLKKHSGLLEDDEICEFTSRLDSFLTQSIVARAKFIDHLSLSMKISKNQMVRILKPNLKKY